jgi:hypothetical protein
MSGALTASLRRAIQRWPVVALLFSASLLAGLTFMVVGWRWLTIGLDGSLATRTLLGHLDVNVFIDLLSHRSDLLSMLVASGITIAAVFSVVWVWLNGIAVLAVLEPHSLATCAARSFSLSAHFLGLWAMSLAVQAAAAASTFGVASFLVRRTAESPSEATFYLIVGTAAGVAAIAVFLLGTIHDHARVYCAATRASAVESYRWALRFVVATERRAVPLALVIVTVAGTAWIVYQSVGMLVAANWMTGVLVSLAWGHVYIATRLLLRVWGFALAAELQERFELGGR